MSAIPVTEPGTGLLEVYAQHQGLLGGSPGYRRSRVQAAEALLRARPDLDAWMAGPLDARLTEVRRRPLAWPLVGFALLTGRCRAQADFLFAKNFGHSMARCDRRSGRTLSLHHRHGSLVVAFCGQPPSQLTEEALDALGEAITTTTGLTGPMRRRRRAGLFGLRRLLFEARILDRPPVHRREGGSATRRARLGAVQAPEIRQTILAYLDARSAVLRPKTIDKLTSALAIFGGFLSERFPQLTTLAALERHHVEAFLTWTATRPCRRPQDGPRQVGPFVTAHAAIALRGFLDDIAAWGWAQAPPRRLVFATDIPRQPDTLPRALPPDVDGALMTAVAKLDDPFARTGLTVLRGTGLRIGELLDLELDCIVDYGPVGSWLRVPLGKFNNERAVPLDQSTLEALDAWLARRSRQRPLPHPRDGRLADFVFVEHGRRLGTTRLQNGCGARSPPLD